MRDNIGKEIRYGLRSSRFLILLAGFLFFALLTPVMMKVVLPHILQSQFAGAEQQDLSALLEMSQLGCIQSYMGDVLEIGTVIVAFSLGGLLAQEIKDNTLVLPLCSGKSFGGIVVAKLVVFGTMLVLAPTVALVVDYLYAGLLFSFDLGIAPIIRAGLLQGTYMLFLLACVLAWGSLSKKPIATGFLTIGTAFSLHFLGSWLRLHAYLPSGLLVEAQQLGEAASSSLPQTLLITAVIILALTAITVQRMKTMEWNER
jgi:ABC-2 type transport system permease protein